MYVSYGRMDVWISLSLCVCVCVCVCVQTYWTPLGGLLCEIEEKGMYLDRQHLKRIEHEAAMGTQVTQQKTPTSGWMADIHICVYVSCHPEPPGCVCPLGSVLQGLRSAAPEPAGRLHQHHQCHANQVLHIPNTQHPTPNT